MVRKGSLTMGGVGLKKMTLFALDTCYESPGCSVKVVFKLGQIAHVLDGVPTLIKFTIFALVMSSHKARFVEYHDIWKACLPIIGYVMRHRK